MAVPTLNWGSILSVSVTKIYKHFFVNNKIYVITKFNVKNKNESHILKAKLLNDRVNDVNDQIISSVYMIKSTML